MPGVQLALGRGTEKQGRAITLRGTRVLIGTSERCSVRLDTDLASPEHAAVVYDGGTWFVRDLGSRHGTYVNGEKVSSGTITEGDLLGFGPGGAEIQVLEVDPPAAREQSVPVLEPMNTPPPATTAVAPARRGAAWPGFLTLLVVIAGLAWLGTRPDDEIRPVARARTPHDLYRLARAAARQDRYEILYDLADAEGRAAMESRINDPKDDESAREACARLGREGGFEVEGPGDGRYVRVDLEADGQSGFMILEDPDGQTRRLRIVRVEGAWRFAGARTSGR